ncbi:MAG: hypothetical protein AAFR61_22720, partial [Bacteroidota bacterium]
RSCKQRLPGNLGGFSADDIRGGMMPGWKPGLRMVGISGWFWDFGQQRQAAETGAAIGFR